MRKHLLITLGVLASLGLRAENAVTLESFETGIQSASVVTTFGGRPTLSPTGVSLSQYSRQAQDDANVTHGDKALKIVLSGRKKFGCDFQVRLSSEASEKVRQATASRDVGRYILRYDVIFPPLNDFLYFNSALYFGDSKDVLISAGGRRSMSVALDLLTGLPSQGPLALLFWQDFDLKVPFTNVTLYLDNIRLVDTYSPGAKPRVYTLQSFEDTNNPTGGASLFTDWDGAALIRAHLSSYTRAHATDIRVSDGDHALEVSNTNPAPWHADFMLPFGGTRLAEVLNLNAPPEQRPTSEQLARYTLRWDVTYPDMTSDWMNTTYHTTAAFLPVIQVRQAKAKDQRQTYSVTLDQIDWGASVDASPTLIFITEGPQNAPSAKIYYDNFRLLDTGIGPTGGQTSAQLSH